MKTIINLNQQLMQHLRPEFSVWDSLKNAIHTKWNGNNDKLGWLTAYKKQVNRESPWSDYR